MSVSSEVSSAVSSLRDLDLGISYNKEENNILNEFYIPCLSNSNHYDRAVGFFSSSIYLLAFPALKDFISNNGEIRIITSPVLSQEDKTALEEGYENKVFSEYKERLLDEIDEFFNKSHSKKPAKILSVLVQMGIVDFKIALMHEASDSRGKKIFHDKLGIFLDDSNNKVVFKGSMNESLLGLSSAGNAESLDVFCNWKSSDENRRVEKENQRFEKMWNDEYQRVSIRNFPDVAREHIIERSDVNTEDWPEVIDEYKEYINESVELSADRGENPRKPYEHQRHALNNWFDAGRKGIFKHATGSGKTFTALCSIRDSLEKGETPIIVVPTEPIFNQWIQELESTFQDIDLRILRCGLGNTRWKRKKTLTLFTRESDTSTVVLSTLATASSRDFMEMVSEGDHIFLVIDEVHRSGAEKSSNIFNLNVGPKLGLSATPKRYRDPKGTNKIFDFFGGIVEPIFTLEDGISEGLLSPYWYRVHTISLTEQEEKELSKISKKVSKLYAWNQKNESNNDSIKEKLKRALINRARIIKSARNKVQKAIEVVKNEFSDGQKWIIYCNDVSQLDRVKDGIKGVGFNPLEYHSKMDGDKETTLKHFEMNGGVLVAIECLDEGVNIPSVTHALILSSSKNPRQFIQRRGRVLRTAKNKNLAYIHDVMVLPENYSDEINHPTIVEGELARAVKFGETAVNESPLMEKFKRFADRFDLSIDELSEEGFE